MLMDSGALLDSHTSCGCYTEDDIVRGLRASLVRVLASALADNELDPDYLKGVFTVARSQAALYDIPWCGLIKSLCDTPELCLLVSRLQEGAQKPCA